MSEFSTWRPDPVMHGDKVFSVDTDGQPVLSQYDQAHTAERREEIKQTELDVTQERTHYITLVRKYTGLYGLPGENPDAMPLSEFAKLDSTASGDSWVTDEADDRNQQTKYMDELTAA